MPIERIAKFVAYVGAGVLVTTAIGSFLCINTFPIMIGECAKTTTEIMDYLKGLGFFTQPTNLIGAGSGVIIYYLTGKWKDN